MDRGMKRAQKIVKSNRRQKRASWLPRAARYVLGALLLLVFMNGVFGENGYLATRRARSDAEKLRLEIQQLNEQNRQLAGDVRALKTDPAAVERVAREEMGLARRGELVFRLPDATPNAATPPVDLPKK